MNTPKTVVFKPNHVIFFAVDISTHLWRHSPYPKINQIKRDMLLRNSVHIAIHCETLYSGFYHPTASICNELGGKVHWNTYKTIGIKMEFIPDADMKHYDDVIMGAMASQFTSLTIVYSTVYSDADQRKHQSSASLAFVREIHRGPVNFPHKWPVTRKMSSFDDVIMNGIYHMLSSGDSMRCGHLRNGWKQIIIFCSC